MNSDARREVLNTAEENVILLQQEYQREQEKLAALYRTMKEHNLEETSYDVSGTLMWMSMVSGTVLGIMYLDARDNGKFNSFAKRAFWTSFAVGIIALIENKYEALSVKIPSISGRRPSK